MSNTKTINDLMFTIKCLEQQKEDDSKLIEELYDTNAGLVSMNASLNLQLDELLYESNRV